MNKKMQEALLKKLKKKNELCKVKINPEIIKGKLINNLVEKEDYEQAAYFRDMNISEDAVYSNGSLFIMPTPEHIRTTILGGKFSATTLSNIPFEVKPINKI